MIDLHDSYWTSYGGPAAFVQHVGGTVADSGYSTTIAWTGSVAVTAGNALVVGCGGYDGAGAASVTDNLGNTYTLVENGGSGLAHSALLVARDIKGGTLTTVTATITNSRYRGIQVAEFANLGAPTAGGGVAETGADPTTGVSSKTIPADGIAVWYTHAQASQTLAAGSASGTPSTTPVLIDYESGDPFLALCYADAGSRQVTGFSGLTDTEATGDYSSSGAVFPGT